MLYPNCFYGSRSTFRRRGRLNTHVGMAMNIIKIEIVTIFLSISSNETKDLIC